MASLEDIKVGPTTLTATDNEVVVSKPGMASATFQLLISSGSITLAFEALTQEGASPVWSAIPAENVATGVVATTATAAGLYRVASAGARRVRARVTAISGSSVLTGNASVGAIDRSAAAGGSGVASAPVVLVGGATGTKTSVAASGSNTLILAFNAARLGATVANDAASGVLYLTLGSTAASVTSFTKRMVPGEFYEIPFGFIGPVRGIWSPVEGNARVTEITA